MKQHLQRMATAAAGWFPDALMVGGVAAVSTGAGMVYEPAGWIVGGLFALAGGVLLSRGAK